MSCFAGVISSEYRARELALPTGIEWVESASLPGKSPPLELGRFSIFSIAAKRRGCGGRAWWESVQWTKTLRMRCSSSIFARLAFSRGGVGRLEPSMPCLNANAAVMESNGTQGRRRCAAACSVLGFVRDRRFTPAGRPFIQDLSDFKNAGHTARAENAHEQNDMFPRSFDYLPVTALVTRSTEMASGTYHHCMVCLRK